jgi:hypothetical protein
MPSSIDEIMRLKFKTEGMKESNMIIGTKFMLNWIDQERLHPFVRKSDKVYQTSLKSKNDNEDFSYKLKFDVQEEEAMIYAAIFDYSGYASLGLTITKADELDDDWESSSIPGKYFSYIPPVSLTKGSYYLTIAS